MNYTVMFADGGSRGNPGPSAAGYVLFTDLNKTERVFGEGVFLGVGTNNQAEYMAIVLGLRKALELGFEEIDVRLDSELAVKQINGQYRVKNAGLQPLYKEVIQLARQFSVARFVHVRRELNKEADAYVNQALDAR